MLYDISTTLKCHTNYGVLPCKLVSSHQWKGHGAELARVVLLGSKTQQFCAQDFSFLMLSNVRNSFQHTSSFFLGQRQNSFRRREKIRIPVNQMNIAQDFKSQSRIQNFIIRSAKCCKLVNLKCSISTILFYQLATFLVN